MREIDVEGRHEAELPQQGSFVVAAIIDAVAGLGREVAALAHSGSITRTTAPVTSSHASDATPLVAVGAMTCAPAATAQRGLIS